MTRGAQRGTKGPADGKVTGCKCHCGVTAESSSSWQWWQHCRARVVMLPTWMALWHCGHHGGGGGGGIIMPGPTVVVLPMPLWHHSRGAIVIVAVVEVASLCQVQGARDGVAN